MNEMNFYCAHFDLVSFLILTVCFASSSSSSAPSCARAPSQDVITDAYAVPMPLDAPGLPAASYSHAGFIEAATWLCADLDRTRVLERFFEARPDYTLVCASAWLGGWRPFSEI
jgi:hypothetical protein